MKEKDMEVESKKIVVNKCHHHGHNESSALYGIGVIGALFYFLQGASTFVTVMMGIGKAIFWPALVIYKVLTLLQI